MNQLDAKRQSLMLPQIKKVTFALFILGSILATTVRAQEVTVVKANGLFDIVEKCDDAYDLCVYNFWATWCAPCVRELPQFEAAAKHHKEINLTLVSLDDKDDILVKVKPFLLKKDIKSRVVLLDETDYNEIIPRVSDQWSGAIPATLIIDRKNGKRYFYEKEFKEDELEETINELLNINY